MFGFEAMFDLNCDGHIDSFERAAQYQFLDELFRKRTIYSFQDDDERDVFGDAGLDYDELEFMDPKERREVLKAAGLNPKEFDF